MKLQVPNLSFKKTYEYLLKKLNGKPFYNLGFSFNNPQTNGYLKYYYIYEGFEALVLDAEFKEDCIIDFTHNSSNNFILHSSLSNNISLETTNNYETLSNKIIFHKPDNARLKIHTTKNTQWLIVKFSMNYIKTFPEKKWDFIHNIIEQQDPKIIIQQNYKLQKYLTRLFSAHNLHYGTKTISIINIYKFCNEFSYILYKASNEQSHSLSLKDTIALNTIHELMLNSTKNLLINDLATQTNMSASKFKKIFTQYFGMPYSKMALKIKMEKSKDLLIKGYTVTEVSNIVNYSQVSKFSYAFKNYYGISPSIIKADSKNLTILKKQNSL